MEVVACYFHLGEKSVHFHSIIESVDSICRDSTDTQYMIIQIISRNLKTVNLYISNIPFFFKCFHDQQHA